jgi:hypothetical protein
MKAISDLLEKFAKLARQSDDAKIAVQEALKESNLIVKDIKYISIKGATVFLKLSPLQKSELFLKQKKILETLSKNPLTKHIIALR